MVICAFLDVCNSKKLVKKLGTSKGFYLFISVGGLLDFYNAAAQCWVNWAKYLTKV